MNIQLREAGGSAMYKSAKALFTFLCDKYISLARYFPNKADTRAEISAVCVTVFAGDVPSTCHNLFASYSRSIAADVGLSAKQAGACSANCRD